MGKNNVVVDIRGTQTIENEKSVTEFSVVGTLERTDEGYFIEYTEYGPDESESRTEITANGDIVSMTKFGEHTTEMVFQSNKRHNCNYATPFGNIDMGVFTKKAHADLCTDGGLIELEYSIDFNSGFVSKNTMNITVTSSQE